MSAASKPGRKWVESPEAKRRRLEAHARRRRHQPVAEPWATDGEKAEARFGGYVLRLGRLAWQYGSERPPFTVKPRMGRPKRAEPIAAE